MTAPADSSEPLTLNPATLDPDGIGYSRLNSDEIRLLVLLPGSDKLECELIHCQFQNFADGAGKKYEALSYMWGPLTPTDVITVNGKSCVVRRNLWKALLALRHKDQPRNLWIDAICINQNDLQEKSHLVAKMNHVYEQAEKVVVWLGDSADDSDYTFQCLYGDFGSEGWDAFDRRACKGIRAIFERPYVCILAITTFSQFIAKTSKSTVEKSLDYPGDPVSSGIRNILRAENDQRRPYTACAPPHGYCNSI